MAETEIISEAKMRDEHEQLKSVIVLSSSSSSSSEEEEDASEDPILEIVDRSRNCEAERRDEEDLEEIERKRFRSPVVIDLSSSSSDEVEIVADWRISANAVDAAAETKKKKKKNKMKINEQRDVDIEGVEETAEAVTTIGNGDVGVLENAKRAEYSLETVTTADAEVVEAGDHLVTVEAMDMEATGMSVKAREPLEKTETMDQDAIGTPKNAVLLKLLRGPRYFDPFDSHWQTCNNCGEEGHTKANCTEKKRKKPCFVCGKFDHSVKHCTEGHDCYICGRRGHFAKECPEKHLDGSQDSKICLRCGDAGHVLSVCKNDYPPDDLKWIQCYICKRFGHLCCFNIMGTGPREVSCYNCGRSGHTGLGCAKPRWRRSSAAMSKLCYKCGEDGHFARSCLKSALAQTGRWMGESSTSVQSFSNEGREVVRYKFAPHDIDEAHKRRIRSMIRDHGCQET